MEKKYAYLSGHQVIANSHYFPIKQRLRNARTSQLQTDRDACPEAHLPFTLFQEFFEQLVAIMNQLLGITSLLTLRWLAECLCLSVEFYCPPVVKPEISGTLQAPEFIILPEKTGCTHKAIHSPRLVGASSPVTWTQGSLERSGCSNPK